MSAARLISSTASARTPTSALVDLRRVDATARGSLGHFVPAGAGPTLCGIELPAPRPVAIVRCPRCLALAMPGLSGERGRSEVSRGTVPSRPIVLMDVDGVLLASPPRRGRPPRMTPARAGRRVAEIDARYADWLRQLAEQYDLAWASSWGRLAAEVIGPSLGLSPYLPAVALTATDWERTRKLPDVARFVGDRPCAWVDDQLGADAFAWARERAAPTLLLKTDPNVGLQRKHLQQLLLFASAVRGAWVADPRMQ